MMILTEILLGVFAQNGIMIYRDESYSDNSMDCVRSHSNAACHMHFHVLADSIFVAPQNIGADVRIDYEIDNPNCDPLEIAKRILEISDNTVKNTCSACRRGSCEDCTQQ